MTDHIKHKIRETSLEAYIDILKELSERHQVVYSAFFNLCSLQGDATDYEVAKFLGKNDPNFVRPRRYELLNQFKVVEISQKRECNITGKNAIAWKIRLGKKYFRKMKGGKNG